MSRQYLAASGVNLFWSDISAFLLNRTVEIYLRTSVRDESLVDAKDVSG